MKLILDIRLFVDLAEFTCFYQFLHDVILELFCFDLQNSFYQFLHDVIIKTDHNLQELVKTGKFS